jgi:CxxC motif-containing protein (DUF1111 family)
MSKISRLQNKAHRTAGAVTLRVPVVFAGMLVLAAGCLAQTAVDPGIRTTGPTPGARFGGIPIGSNLDLDYKSMKATFVEINERVQNPIGLGPGFSSHSCNSCHAFPADGGSSPRLNPLFAIYQLNGATNTMPPFITQGGPVVNARAPFLPDGITPDGKIQQLFVITGRTDAPGCNTSQPDFATEYAQNRLIFRQTTPLFGLGLVEILQDRDILASFNSTAAARAALGIGGHPSIAEDGSISRFGWKAQHRSLILFSGDAYNMEEGITNELSPNEINNDPNCATNPLPEDHTVFSKSFNIAAPYDGDPLEQAGFMRFTAPPLRGTATTSTNNGQFQFNKIGCNLCHTPQFTTPQADVPQLSNVKTNVFSDLMVHHMGFCAADDVVQGNVMGDEFRTAPLWNVSQRVFFMHDGMRTHDIVEAIELHSCPGNNKYPPSEANAVINAFNALSPTNQQDLVNFLRIL